MALAMTTKAKLRFMDLQGGLFLSDFPAFRKAFHYGKTRVTGGYIYKALSVPFLYSANESLSAVFPTILLRIIERIMQPAALLAVERRINDQRRDRSQVAQLQQIHRHLKIPIKLTNLALQIAQPRAGPLQALIRAHNSDVIPHQSPD